MIQSQRPHSISPHKTGDSARAEKSQIVRPSRVSRNEGRQSVRTLRLCNTIAESPLNIAAQSGRHCSDRSCLLVKIEKLNEQAWEK
jgi:hypothetical protein